MQNTMKETKDFLQLFEAYRRQQTFGHQPPRELYEPIDYIMDMGGKRLRPMLVLLGCHQFSDDPRRALPAALAVEVFHNFSLIHDDIMDAAPLRRGQATVHERYGLNAGILSGDVMLILAYDFLLRTPPPASVSDMVTVLSKVAIKVCEGQQYDMNFERLDTVTADEYLRMIELKTAVLLAASLQLGALAAVAPPTDAHYLYEFGRLTGIAFQLQDDYLDVFGDPAKVGKQAGGDILQNKKTILFIKALERAGDRQRRELGDWYAQTTDDPRKVSAVTAIMRDLDIPAYARDLRYDYQQRAYEQLDRVDAPAERKAPLRRLTEALLDREQ